MPPDRTPCRPPVFDLDDFECDLLERYARLGVPRSDDFADDLVAHLDEVARRRRARARALRELIDTYSSAEGVLRD